MGSDADDTIRRRWSDYGIDGPPPAPVSLDDFLARYPDIDSEDPGNSHIKAVAVKRLRETDEAEYRRMAKKGELDEYLDRAVESVRSDASWRLDAGYMESEAWRLAIRTQVYGLEED